MQDQDFLLLQERKGVSMEKLFKRLEEPFLKCGLVRKKGNHYPFPEVKLEINQNKIDYKQRYSDHWTKLKCQNVIGGSRALGVPRGKGFPEAPTGGWGFVESFNHDVKLREFPSKVPPLSIPPWEMSSGVFSRAELRPLPRISVAC